MNLRRKKTQLQNNDFQENSNTLNSNLTKKKHREEKNLSKVRNKDSYSIDNEDVIFPYK